MNTTDSRVDISLDLNATSALTPAQRVRAVIGSVSAQSSPPPTYRSQHRNRVAAGSRMADRLRDALAPPSARARADEEADPGLGGAEGSRASAGAPRSKALRGRVRPD